MVDDDGCDVVLFFIADYCDVSTFTTTYILYASVSLF
jgi:hypothetical protein